MNASLETITIGETSYRVTEAGRPLVGKLLPTPRHAGNNASTRGVAVAKTEPADKHRGRILAAIAKLRSKDVAERVAPYIGRLDGPWIMRETDGHVGAFEYAPNASGTPLKSKIATPDRSIAFAITPAVELAIKRAKVVSAPCEWITIAVEPGRVVIGGYDRESTTTSEETINMPTEGAGTIRIDVRFLALFFGRPDLVARADAGTVAGRDGQATRLGTLAIDVDGWRYVVALAKA
jgi:hypothetical protein